MARRDGFTLIETLIVVVVLGLMGLIALPKFQNALGHANVLSAKAKVTSLYAKARAAAVESSRTGILVITGGNAYVVARPRLQGAGAVDTITRPENLYTQYQVNISSDVDSVRISPTGLGLGAAQIILTKGSYADTVFISQYGRILK